MERRQLDTIIKYLLCFGRKPALRRAGKKKKEKYAGIILYPELFEINVALAIIANQGLIEPTKREMVAFWNYSS